MQTASITTGLPFAIVLLIMCYSVYKGLSYEHGVVVEGRALEEAEAAHLSRLRRDRLKAGQPRPPSAGSVAGQPLPEEPFEGGGQS